MRILVTNDDGPPSHESPFIAPFVDALLESEDLNDLVVVLPASNKSWIGKSFMIKETVQVSNWEHTDLRGKTHGWTLLETTPATCANIGISHLHAGEPFDLVISGPNFGRNSSNVMAFSSGTLGAALESSLLGTKGIALSFAFYLRPGKQGFPPELISRAVAYAVKVVRILSSTNINLWNVNIPLVPSPTPILLTTMQNTAYHSLFKPVESPFEVGLDNASSSSATSYKWAPLFLTQTSPEQGSDGWALNMKCASATPLSGNMECLTIQSLPQSSKPAISNDLFDELNQEMFIEATKLGIEAVKVVSNCLISPSL